MLFSFELKVINVRFILHWLEVGKGTSDTVLSSAVNQCVQKVNVFHLIFNNISNNFHEFIIYKHLKQLLKSAETVLLEPIMSIEVVTDDNNSSSVISDFGRRRGFTQDITTRSNNRVFNMFIIYND